MRMTYWRDIHSVRAYGLQQPTPQLLKFSFQLLPISASGSINSSFKSSYSHALLPANEVRTQRYCLSSTNSVVLLSTRTGRRNCGRILLVTFLQILKFVCRGCQKTINCDTWRSTSLFNFHQNTPTDAGQLKVWHKITQFQPCLRFSTQFAAFVGSTHHTPTPVIY